MIVFPHIIKYSLRFFGCFLLLTLLLSCSSDDDSSHANMDEENPNPPAINALETYSIGSDLDVTYAQGLSHENLNSVNATPIDLKLDVYYPENNSDNRPAYLFIHGGGFIDGDKQGGSILNLANYYASRGWVFVSINYRLRGDLGTTPQAWLDFSASLPPQNSSSQVNAIYPAQRDAKAALRWLVVNAATYHINTDYITVGGGSAGAITAITVGVSEPEDFRDELDVNQDSTLSSTNPNVDYQIKTIVDHWGSNVALDILEEIFGHQRFDANDPPLFIAHGTQDSTVDFSNAEELNTIYQGLNIPIALYPINEPGHGLWNANINGKRLEELALEFIVEQQGLLME